MFFAAMRDKSMIMENAKILALLKGRCHLRFLFNLSYQTIQYLNLEDLEATKILFETIFFQPLNLQECTVPHLKDLIHICLQTEAKVHSMTFNVSYVGSKYPNFLR